MCAGRGVHGRWTAPLGANRMPLRHCLGPRAMRNRRMQRDIRLQRGSSERGDWYDDFRVDVL
jgi:hypothetical protein